MLQFRLWLRRAPAIEKGATALVAVLGAVLVGWALVPGRGPAAGTSAEAPRDTPRATTPAPTSPTAPGAVAATVTTPAGSAPAAGSGGAPGPTAPAPAPANASPLGSGAGTPACPGGGTGAPGISATEVHIGVSIPDAEGQAGNGLVGLPSPQQEQAYFQAAIDWVNAHGGIQCRKLAATYYDGNVLDPNQEHSLCLQVVQDNPFAVLDTNFAYIAAVKDCLPQAKIPQFGSSAMLGSEAGQYFPYLFSYYGSWVRIESDFVLGARQLGWFNGAGKVGILEEECFPELNRDLTSDLGQIGVSGSRLTTFDFGCPAGIIPPNEEAQAVLQFKSSGVTHVIDNAGAVNYFSKDAQQEGYHPKYGVPDGGEVATLQSAGFGPDPNNFDGGLGITTSQYGAEHSGLPETAGTRTCDQIMAKMGAPATEKTPDAFGGTACDLVTMFVAAASRASPLTRTNLVTGLDRAGSVDFSFPAGPAKFDQPGVVTGGQYWRQVVFSGTCSCFKVPDPTYRPNF